MKIKLPDAEKISKTLDMMIGEETPLKEGAPDLDLGNAPEGTYVSWLYDDSGETLGAIITTLAAAVYLGGTMILIPPARQEDQVDAGQASEAVIDSIAEINNMLRGLLNRHGENVHVSPGKIEIFQATANNSWVTSARERQDLTGELPYGEGRLIILAR